MLRILLRHGLERFLRFGKLALLPQEVAGKICFFGGIRNLLLLCRRGGVRRTGHCGGCHRALQLLQIFLDRLELGLELADTILPPSIGRQSRL